MSLVNRSSERVESILAAYHTDMERPADLIADVMHYCTVNHIDFNEELLQAEQYVCDEMGFDEEFPA